jgi:hypothetical protein
LIDTGDEDETLVDKEDTEDAFEDEFDTLEVLIISNVFEELATLTIFPSVFNVTILDKIGVLEELIRVLESYDDRELEETEDNITVCRV